MRLWAESSKRYKKLWVFQKNYSIIIFLWCRRHSMCVGKAEEAQHFGPFLHQRFEWLSGQFISPNIRTDYFSMISSLRVDLCFRSPKREKWERKKREAYVMKFDQVFTVDEWELKENALMSTRENIKFFFSFAAFFETKTHFTKVDVSSLSRLSVFN